MAGENTGAPAGAAPNGEGAGAGAGGAAGGSPPAAGAPAAGAPAAGSPPAGGAPAGQPAAGAPPAGKGKPKGGRSSVISIPSAQFRERIDRDAKHKVQAALGMTLEEAKAALERAKTGQPAPAGQHGPDPATQRELDKVREEHAQLTRRVEKQSAKIKKIRGRNRARMMEMELRHDAVAAGIEAGENVDFAIQRMRADYHAFKADPAKNAALKPFFEQEDIDAQGYFRALLARRPYLGKAGGQPVSASPTTAPPASTRPGEEPPPVQTPGTPPKAFDAMKASDDEWREHKRRHGIPG